MLFSKAIYQRIDFRRFGLNHFGRKPCRVFGGRCQVELYSFCGAIVLDREPGIVVLFSRGFNHFRLINTGPVSKLCAFLNPLANNFQLLRGARVAFSGGRHNALFFSREGDALVQYTVFWQHFFDDRAVFVAF